MVDTQKSSMENSARQLRSGRTSGEAQQYTRKHPAKSKTVKQATYKLDADPGKKIPDPEGKTSSPTRKNQSSSPQISTKIPGTKEKCYCCNRQFCKRDDNDLTINYGHIRETLRSYFCHFLTKNGLHAYCKIVSNSKMQRLKMPWRITLKIVEYF
ncbi:uncharacterized protein LOC121772413 [Salvia splendens]|uniref:uncharacterized protein LOC121772413 n=1 Tax=Salvia splendens TaxID=180675 RepID=UPI001C26FB72|nr:uncharacterized protein LOC121772413 [Salvia splendens]